MKIYVKDVVRKPKDTLYTFLNKVVRFNGGAFAQGTANATYLDPEFKKLQCVSGKHRSFDDLISISKTYFKVSDKIIAKTIIKLIDKNDKLILVLCDTAKKWVLNSYLTKSEILKYCATYNKSDLKTDERKEGKYSFDDIITLAGLTKEDIKINN